MLDKESAHRNERERNKSCQAQIQALLRRDLANTSDLCHPLDDAALMSDTCLMPLSLWTTNQSLTEGSPSNFQTVTCLPEAEFLKGD